MTLNLRHVCLAVVLVGFVAVVATPAAAQATGEVDLAIQPSTGETTSGTVQTYDIVVQEPDAGISAYEKVEIVVGDNTVANITSFTETVTDTNANGPISASEIQDNGATLVLDTALLDETFGASSSVTIARMDVEAVGSAGQSTTLSFNQSTDQDVRDNDGSIYTVRNFEDASLSVAQPANFDVTLTSVPSAVTEGEAATVSYEVTNTGDVTDTQDIAFAVNGTTEGRNSGLTLNGSETVTGQFSYTTVMGDAPALSVGVSSDDTTANQLLTVNEPANLDVVVTSVPSAVTAGETATVSYEVTNTGDVQGTQDITFAVNGTSQGTNSGLALDSGQTFAGQFSYATTASDVPQITTSVSSADDSASEAVTVNEPANFDVAVTSVNSSVTTGETVVVDYEVTNTGDVQATQDITFAVNGTSEGTNSGLTLSGGQTFAGQFSYATSGSDVPQITASVSSADDSASEAVTVSEPANFDVTLTSVPSAVTEGETATVGYEVTNTGATQATQDITFAVNGTTEGTNSGLTLNGSETFTGQFSYTTVTGDAPALSLGVSSDDTTANRLLTVQAPANFDVVITSVPSAVTEGETLTIAYEVTNTGDVQATQDIAFAVNGTTEETNSGLALNGSETFAGQFSYATSGSDLPQITTSVSSADSSASEAVTVNEPASFGVSNLQPQSLTVTNGTTVDISADITNNGDLQATQTLTLSVGGFTQTQSLTLAAGANSTVTFPGVDTSALGTGNYSHEVASANDSASGTLMVAPAPSAPTFLVSGLQPAAVTVTNGTTLDISAVVENAGDQQGTQTVTLSVGGVSLTQNLTLAGGANQTVTFQNVDTGALGPGNYSHEVASANDSATGSLTVQAASAFFEVSSLQPTDPTVADGAVVSISADVQNTGGQQDTRTVELTVNGSSLSTTETLAAGANTTVTFSVDTTQLGPGIYPFTVSSPDDTESGSLTVQAPANFEVSNLEPQSPTVTNGTTVDISADVRNTGDLAGTQTVTLTAGTLTRTKSVALNQSENVTVVFGTVDTGALGPGTYTHEIASANDSASGTLTVEATGLAQSLVFDNQTITNDEVVVERVRSDGVLSVVLVTYQNSSGRVVAGVSAGTFTDQNVSVLLAQNDGFPGEYTAHILPAADRSQDYQPGEVVSTATAANITDSETATVSAPPQSAVLQVTSLEPASATVTNGTALDISARIENTGTEQATQTVTLSVGSLDTSQTLTLAAGANQTVTFQNVDTGALGPGTYSHEVASANDSANGTLTVEAQSDLRLDFNNQSVDDSSVLVENVSSNGTQSVVLVTYEEGSESVVVGALGGVFDDTGVSVPVGGFGGFPNQYTAHVLPASGLSREYSPGDVLSTATAANITDNETATVSPDPTPPQQSLAFGDQQLGTDDTVVVESISSGGATSAVVVTYANASGEVVAGVRFGSFTGGNLTLSLGTTGGVPGDHTARIVPTTGLSREYQPGDLLSQTTPGNAGDNATANITAPPQEPAVFRVSNLQPAGASVANGTALDVSANVTNTGDSQGTQEVTLSIGALNAAQSVSLAPGATTTVTFQNVSTTAVGVGEYPFQIASADDSASGTLTVEPSLFVESYSVSARELAVGTTLTVTATVRNTRSTSAELIVPLRVDGTTANTTTVTVGANTTTTVTLQVDSLPTGTSNVTVASLFRTRVTVRGPDVTGDGALSTDPDDDGRYEDIDGDGGVDLVDVQALFGELNNPLVTGNDELFDFQPLPGVSVLDVQGLFNELPES